MEHERLEQEWSRHFDSYAEPLFRFCYFKVHDREVARDLVGEIFLKVLTSAKAGTDIKNVRAFLYETARNLIIDWYRKHKSESLDSLIEEGFDPKDTGVDAGKNAEASFALHILHKLDTDDQELIVWRYVEGISPRDIALILGESENVTSVRIHRALKRLQHLLKSNE